jgi:hypothetical protein
MSAVVAGGQIAPWSAVGYRDLLEHLRSSSVRTYDLQEFSDGEEGVWLRHDVEIDLSAALRIATVEADLGARAWYFLCVESPFVHARPDVLRQWAFNIQSLGHVVSLHMLLGPGLEPLEDRIRSAIDQLGIESPGALTFHAPGLDAQVLAQVPGGELVYGRLAENKCQYLSDSTSRWRWGSPWHADFTLRPTQLLTHPFWWVGDRSRVAELCVESAEHATFLPQFRREVLGV